jgi:hypothetical protein
MNPILPPKAGNSKWCDEPRVDDSDSPADKRNKRKSKKEKEQKDDYLPQRPRERVSLSETELSKKRKDEGNSKERTEAADLVLD